MCRFWRGMYGRFESGVHPRESMNDLLLASQDHTNSLEDHVQHLTKRIGYLKNLISKSAKRFQNASKPKSDEPDISNDNKYVQFPFSSFRYCKENIGVFVIVSILLLFFSFLDLNMIRKWVNCHVLTRIIHWNRWNHHHLHQRQILTLALKVFVRTISFIILCKATEFNVHFPP